RSTDWILTAKVTSGKSFIDNAESRPGIARPEIAPVNPADPHRAEKARRHFENIRRRPVDVMSGDAHGCSPPILTQQRPSRQRSSFHARRLAEAVGQVVPYLPGLILERPRLHHQD